MVECGPIEPCHIRDCDGYDELLALLPPGKIWNPDRGGTYGAYIRALGDIKTELNQRICQEWRELNPCTADRLLPYWINVYSLPPCVDQTAEKLCEWIELLQGDCPIGSLGFLRRAIEFVAPGKGITIDVTYPELGANCPCPDSLCASENPLIVTAPPEVFYYETFDSDEPVELQDGENCRVYFIPEIECLRPCIFPFGLGVGYQTNPLGPIGQDIYGVPDANELARTQWQTVCDGASTVVDECQFNYRPPVAPASAIISGVELTALGGTFGQFTGNAPMALTASGLPAGVTFTDNGDGTWTLGGAFPVEGSYSYQVTGTNPFGTASSTNSIIATSSVVCIAPTAPAIADLAGVQGGALNYTSPAWAGTAPIALSVTGLPSGVAFADNGDGTFTLGGVYPASGTYALSVAGANACGSDSGSFDITATAIANPITIAAYNNSSHPCAVALSPSCGQFVFQMRPNGQIWVGSNLSALALATGGAWHNGTVAGGDYEARLTMVSGSNPISPTVGVWHDLASFVTATWDFCGSGEDFNTVQIEIRDKATSTIQSQVTFCQQVGADVTCQTC